MHNMWGNMEWVGGGGEGGRGGGGGRIVNCGKLGNREWAPAYVLHHVPSSHGMDCKGCLDVL